MLIPKECAGKPQCIVEALYARLLHEHEADYPDIGRLPSNEARFFADYASHLQANQRPALMAALAKCGAKMLLTKDAPAIAAAEEEAYARYRSEAAGKRRLWQFWPLRLLKQAAGWDKSPKTQEKVGVPADVIAWVDRMTTAKAGAMRKHLSGALKPLGFAGENGGGGNWRYTRAEGGRSVHVDVDFGSMHAQLRYEVFVEDIATGIRLERLCYENILGFGLGWWDFVSEEKIADGIAVFAQFVADAAQLPDALSG